MLATARRELERAQAPESRLIAAIAAMEQAERELAALRAADDQQLAAWLSGGCEGARPGPSIETLDLEHALGRSRADGTAAAAALPGVQEAVRQASEQVAAAARMVQSATWRVVVEAAETYATAHLAPAVAEVARIEAKAKGLEELLWTAGRRDGFEAMSCAAKVREIIDRCRPTGTAPDTRPAAALLAALASDPSAVLEAE